jgi:NAD(P)-dependent dehydrogenase (short-subunit alcohol dehydrogenase family)
MSARSSSFPETALVTGAASGIGRALVERLEREGARVLGLDLRDGFDVADPAAWQAVGPVDLACLNAGTFTGTTDVRELSDEAYRRILATNVDGVVFGVRRLASVMDSGSAIVVTASLAGLTTIEIDPVYGGTKHFVVGFVRSVAPQLSERGLTINAVCPAAVDTPMVSPIRERLVAAGISLLRPEEIADAVLLSARSADTGQAWACLPGRPPQRHEFPRFFESA